MQILNVYTGKVIFEDASCMTWEGIIKGALKQGANLSGANLYGANLRSANLSGANLRSANLYGANLSGANLYGADLYGANLRSANLSGANLYGANLYGADLYGANLRSANLSGANLYGANLRSANLSGANLHGANNLSEHFLATTKVAPEEGEFIAWKKITTGVIKIKIPEHAGRCNAVGSRKCRASEIIVIGGDVGGKSPTHTEKALTYNLADIVKADKFDGDIFEECSSGIHFFMTKIEAEEYI